MITTESSPLYSIGRPLDMSAASWGELEDSSPLLGDIGALRSKMSAEGYLYIRDFFPREIIQEARTSMLQNLAEQAVFDSGYPLDEGMLKEDANPGFSPEVAKGNEAVKRVVFGPEMRSFYREFLGGDIRHFDFIWVRSKGKGWGTAPHCDIVYMGRGTRQLYTAWIPYGDVSYELGGLTILEKSHLQADRIHNYLHSDVDTYCENNPKQHGWKFNGILSKNPVTLRERFGGRWLSAEFRMGDLLTFTMETVHASLDNSTNRIRLSTDTRYQLASEPVDERWIGDDPIAHGQAGKRGRIC